jgi:cobalamin biosynthesis Mg chelatase CobN
MKTILEWYEELPEPIRSQAIANYDYENSVAITLSGAIATGFNWGTTPEGFDYWSDSQNTYDPQPTTLEQSLSDLTKSLEEMKEAIESVRKAIGNESTTN